MSKREGKDIGDAAAVKRLRLTAVGTEDAPRDTSHPRAPSGGSSHSATVSCPLTPLPQHRGTFLQLVIG